MVIDNFLYDYFRGDFQHRFEDNSRNYWQKEM